MKRVLLLGATFDTGNLGVSALAAGALTVVAHRYPQADVALLDYGRRAKDSVTSIGGRDLSVPLVNLRFSWKLLLPNNVAALLGLAAVSRLFGRRAQAWVVRRNAWLRRIAEADAAVAVSGGDSFSDIYGLGRLWYVCLPQLLALSLGVPLVLLPQTIGPFKSGMARGLARFLLHRAARVHSRDLAGLEEVRALLGDGALAGRARFCPDLAFVLEPHRPADGLATEPPAQAGATCAAAPRPLVGLNISGLLLMGGYTRRNMFALEGDYAALNDRLVADFIAAGADVILVPHVCGGGAESDVAAAAATLERLGPRWPGRLRMAGGQHDANEIKYLIGRCDFFVGARMHACIAALSQGIPAVGIAYSDKFAGVFQSAGAVDMIADQRRLGLEDTAALVARAYARRARTREALQAALPGVRARVMALLDDLV